MLYDDSHINLFLIYDIISCFWYSHMNDWNADNIYRKLRVNSFKRPDLVTGHHNMLPIQIYVNWPLIIRNLTVGR